jgi:SAM-dependent methyltransferase
VIDLSRVASNLSRDPLGLWVANSGATASPVSYPEDGNALCAELEDRSFWFRHRNRCILAAVRRHPPGDALFDVGGGNGAVARELVRHGIATVLVEPGRTGAENAHRAGLADVVCATLSSAGFRDHSLPSVGLFDVLEHMERDGEFLDQIRRALAPGGRLYITVPAYQAIWSAEDESAGHFRRYTRRALCRVLAAHGFTVEYATYFFWCLPAPILLFRALPSRLGLRADRDLERVRGEHTNGRSGAIERVLAWEPAAIKRGVRIPTGGSVLAVSVAR